MPALREYVHFDILDTKPKDHQLIKGSIKWFKFTCQGFCAIDIHGIYRNVYP